MADTVVPWRPRCASDRLPPPMHEGRPTLDPDEVQRFDCQYLLTTSTGGHQKSGRRDASELYYRGRLTIPPPPQSWTGQRNTCMLCVRGEHGHARMRCLDIGRVASDDIFACPTLPCQCSKMYVFLIPIGRDDLGYRLQGPENVKSTRAPARCAADDSPSVDVRWRGSEGARVTHGDRGAVTHSAGWSAQSR